MKGSGLLASGEIHEFKKKKKKKKHKCNVLNWKFTSSKEQLLKVGEVSWAGPVPAQPGADQTPLHRKMGLSDSQPQGPIVQVQ